MASVNVFCFLASYAIAFTLELTRLLRRSTISRAFMLLFAVAGFVAHTAYLWFSGRQKGLPPLLVSSQDWLLVLAWVAVLFYIFLTSIDRKLAVGLFLLPLVLILIVSAYFANDVPLELQAQQNLKMIHASLLVFGTTGVILGLVLGLMYLGQHHRLKQKQTLTEGLALPSLEKLARLNWWAVIISIPLLTLGMVTGVGLGVISKEPVTFSDPVVVVNGIVWLVLVVFFVWLSTTRRPAGKQVAWLTIWAFGFLLFTMVGLVVLTREGLNTWHKGVGHTQNARLAPIVKASV